MAFRPNWYDRDSSSGAGFNPGSWSGFRWILTLTLGVFAIQVLFGRSLPEVVEWGALRAWWLTDEGELAFNWFFPVQLVSYALLHADGWHLFGNLLYFWITAPDLEGELGRRGLLRLYITGAVVGGLVQWTWWIFRLEPGMVVGASGAVYTLMVLFALKWPHRVLYIWAVLPVPIWLFVGARVLFDVAGFVDGSAGATAVLVHLGGAAVGLAWFKGSGALSRWTARRQREQVVRVKQEESGSRREMDRILAKIQASGLGSLDAREREFLDRRSRELREQGR